MNRAFVKRMKLAMPEIADVQWYSIHSCYFLDY